MDGSRRTSPRKKLVASTKGSWSAFPADVDGFETPSRTLTTQSLDTQERISRLGAALNSHKDFGVGVRAQNSSSTRGQWGARVKPDLPGPVLSKQDNRAGLTHMYRFGRDEYIPHIQVDGNNPDHAGNLETLVSCSSYTTQTPDLISQSIAEDNQLPSDTMRQAHDDLLTESKDAERVLLMQLGYNNDTEKICPRILTLGEISQFMKLIQKQSQGLARSLSSFHLSADQVEAWPLHRLRIDHPELYLSAQLLADASRVGWKTFFTSEKFRRHLMNAIIGEWIVQRIFKHIAFGLDREHIERLENIDREYLHYDAFVRTKEKSAALKEILLDTSYVGDKLLDKVGSKSAILASELIEVIYPLLPPSAYDPLTQAEDVDELAKQFKNRETYEHLIALLFRQAAMLALHIRLSGSDGTIIHTVPHLPKGTAFEPTAPMICVNPVECNATRPQTKDSNIKLCIKMTCWPRIEAIVPHGPTVKDLVDVEETAKKIMTAETYQSKDRETIVKNLYRNQWPILPGELHLAQSAAADRGLEYGQAYNATIDDLRHDPNHSHDHDIDHHHHHNRNQHHQNHHNHDHDNDHEPNEGPTKVSSQPKDGKRGAYVTVYPRLCEASVYCEWTPQPTGSSRPQTLYDAVSEARRQHGFITRIEDGYIYLYNHWSTYGAAYQWLILLGVVTYFIRRSRIIDLATDMICKSLQTLLSGFGHLLSTSVQALLSGFAYLLSPIAAKLQQLILKYVFSVDSSVKGSSPLPLIIREILEPYIIALGELIQMDPDERNQHLPQTISLYLHDTLRPFAAVSFSVPAAVREIFKGPTSYNFYPTRIIGDDGVATQLTRRINMIRSTTTKAAPITAESVVTKMAGFMEGDWERWELARTLKRDAVRAAAKATSTAWRKKGG